MPEVRWANGRYRLRPSILLWVLLAAFALWVWPTPYRYFVVGQTLFRQSRFTQCVSPLTPTGWTRPPAC